MASIDIYLVTWLDAWSDHATHIPIEELRPEPPRRSVGFLVKEDKQYLYLATSFNGGGYIGGWLKIPRVCVVRRSRLRRVSA